jgi:hypothetical protein
MEGLAILDQKDHSRLIVNDVHFPVLFFHVAAISSIVFVARTISVTPLMEFFGKVGNALDTPLELLLVGGSIYGEATEIQADHCLDGWMTSHDVRESALSFKIPPPSCRAPRRGMLSFVVSVCNEIHRGK